MMIMKPCSKCKQIKDEGCFSKDNAAKDGLCSRCKACTAVYQKDYYLKHKEDSKDHRKAYMKVFCQDNKETKKVYNKVYYQENYLKYIWHNMINRCTNPKNKAYKDYGGRGIEVCSRWLNSFEAFREDVGERPLGPTQFSIDRIFNDGNYEPSNVKWATKEEQRNNQRNNKKRKTE